MKSVLAEGAEMIEEDADEEVRDAGLVAAAQRVEYYEMAEYGNAKTFAESPGDHSKIFQERIKHEIALFDPRLQS